MKTVDLTLVLRDANKKQVVSFFNKLKELQDVPCEELNITELGESDLEVLIRYPLRIFDQTASQFMAALFGEFPYMRSFGKAYFKDLVLPEEVWGWFGGPTYGAEGIKDRIGAASFPLCMAIIKPSISDKLTVDTIARSVDGPVAGGFSFVKDDEMQGNFPYATLEERLQLARKNRHYVPTVNVDSVDAYKEALAYQEIGMVLLNGTVIGFPMLNTISRDSKVAILSHLSLQGTYRPSFSPRLYAMLHRLFGCDALITPIGDTHYYRASKEEEHEMVTALTEEAPVKPTLPFLTGGGTLENIGEIVEPYLQKKVPYALVFGTLVFGAEETPEQMARSVMEEISKHTENQ
jgi:ribulose 1,5-bisphosphate carboxylase large subunit-like protein